MAQADVFGVAHRGGRWQGPENTLEVFQLTMDLGGMPWLETDTWLSSDGVPMIHHDRSMCRTTNIGDLPGYDCSVAANNPLGRFPEIRDFTVAELKQLDVGSWFDPSFANTRMPTLEEALEFVDGTGVPLLVEFKNTNMSIQLKEILDRTGLSWDNIIVWARQEGTRSSEFHQRLPGIRQITGQRIPADVTYEFLAERAFAGDYGIGVQGLGLTQELIDRVHQYGLLLYTIPATTGQDPVQSRIAMGVDANHTSSELVWADTLADYPCIDRIDNDGDGKIDFDGVDIDFDMGRVIDIMPDPGCDDRLAGTEVAACQDLIDNDGDGLVDLDDPGCTEPNDRSEKLVGVPSLSGPLYALLAAMLLVVTCGVMRRAVPSRGNPV